MRRGCLNILLIEDDEHDVFFVEKALERTGTGHNLHSVRDGEEAIRYLRGEGQFADRASFPLPNVILTDLKMPRMDGFGFLRWVRSHPECSIIPTIVYSSSGHDQDVKEAYQLGANSYIVKPTDLNELVETLGIMYEYWSRCERPALPQAC